MTSKKLKDIRAKLGITQKELAKEIGVEENSVWRYENDKVKISKTIALAVEMVAEKHKREKQNA